MTDRPGGRASPILPTDPEYVGPYRVVGRLGQGGMGTVFLARDQVGRAVAIKVVRADLAAEAEFRQRFRSEVEQARQVPPFCTAEVLDADPECRTPYLVVEYVDGPDLAEAVASNGPLTSGNLPQSYSASTRRWKTTCSQWAPATKFVPTKRFALGPTVSFSGRRKPH